MSDDPIRADSVPVRPAATVMLLRGGGDGLEVFMLQRSHDSSFARSQYVFPGGRVDDADDAVTTYEPISDGVTDASVSARLGLERGGLAWLVAAIRECFEEAGVLLARRTGEHEVISFDDPDVATRFDAARHRIHDNDFRLVDLCRDEDLQLLTDRMRLVDHWITPLGERRRFDTRFFIAHAPADQHPLHDDSETIASLWTTPDAALDRLERGELSMFPPTIASLRWLRTFADPAEAMAAAASIGIPTPILPKLVVDDDHRVTGVVRPGDPGYDDARSPEFVVESFR